MICPKCEATKDKFVFRKLTKEDYAKIRRGRKRLPNRADLLILGSGVTAFTAALVCSYYGMSVITFEETDTMGGEDSTGFSEYEQNAAFESLKRSIDTEAFDVSHMEYHQLAASMLALLAEEDVLPEFKEATKSPYGAPHPWGSFSESISLDMSPEEDKPILKTTLLNQLSYWSTDNEVRTLINHKPSALLENSDKKIVGIEFEFNDKAVKYQADFAILSFLDAENKELVKNIKSTKEKGAKCIGFKEVDRIPYKKITKEESQFWGEEAQIGPSMTRAFKMALEIVDKFDFHADED